MTITIAYRTDSSQACTHQTDYIWVNRQAGVFVLADGGGIPGTATLASRLAATTVGQIIARQSQISQWSISSATAKAILTDAVETAHQRLTTAAAILRAQPGMHAAIVATFVYPPMAYICHVGNTRAYLARAGQLTCLNGSLLMRMVAGDTGTEQEGSPFLPGYHPPALGRQERVQPECIEVQLAVGDWLLLCSDGLWSMVDDITMHQIVDQHMSDPAPIAEALVAAAHAAGSQDTISVVVIGMAEDSA